jgi:hypothetical protein
VTWRHIETWQVPYVVNGYIIPAYGVNRGRGSLFDTRYSEGYLTFPKFQKIFDEFRNFKEYFTIYSMINKILNGYYDKKKKRVGIQKRALLLS